MKYKRPAIMQAVLVYVTRCSGGLFFRMSTAAIPSSSLASHSCTQVMLLSYKDGKDISFTMSVP
jgi:hypothetical protein